MKFVTTPGQRPLRTDRRRPRRISSRWCPGRRCVQFCEEPAARPVDENGDRDQRPGDRRNRFLKSMFPLASRLGWKGRASPSAPKTTR
ncbi:MAG: hypothetical protein MZV64_19285 [Ignavibacteriales bacterium]|nr:hypothetical protein [Ignavibacteriales bacterium]